MIVRLDGQPIKKAEDVLTHFDQTTVDFINIRTGKLERRVVQLPGQAGRSAERYGEVNSPRPSHL